MTDRSVFVKSNEAWLYLQTSAKTTPRKRLSLPSEESKSQEKVKDDKASKHEKSSRKRKSADGVDSYKERIAYKISKNDSPSIEKRLNKVAENLQKVTSRGKKRSESSQSKFPLFPCSSHSDSKEDKDEKKTNCYSSSEKPGSSISNLLTKAVYTKKNPLVPVTLTKSHTHKKSYPVTQATTSSWKPVSNEPKSKIGVENNKETKRDKKSVSHKDAASSKWSDDDDDGWYYDPEPPKWTGGSVHVHKPKRYRDESPPRHLLSIQVDFSVILLRIY